MNYGAPIKIVGSAPQSPEAVSTSGLLVIRPELARTIQSRIKSNFPQRNFWEISDFTCPVTALIKHVDYFRYASRPRQDSFPHVFV